MYIYFSECQRLGTSSERSMKAVVMHHGKPITFKTVSRIGNWIFC